MVITDSSEELVPLSETDYPSTDKRLDISLWFRGIYVEKMDMVLKFMSQLQPGKKKGNILIKKLVRIVEQCI